MKVSFDVAFSTGATLFVRYSFVTETIILMGVFVY
jgi:hypothetical protein